MPGIRMIPVISSNVESIGYDAGTQTLRVEFKGGRIYEYSDVPQEKWEGLNATSVGSYLHREIMGKHASVRLENVEKKPNEDELV